MNARIYTQVSRSLESPSKCSCFWHPKGFFIFLIPQLCNLKILFINITEHFLDSSYQEKSVWSILKLECAYKSPGGQGKCKSSSEGREEMLLCVSISFQMTLGLLKTTVWQLRIRSRIGSDFYIKNVLLRKVIFKLQIIPSLVFLIVNYFIVVSFLFLLFLQNMYNLSKYFYISNVQLFKFSNNFSPAVIIYFKKDEYKSIFHLPSIKILCITIKILYSFLAYSFAHLFLLLKLR